jgi:hypothetical protein
VTPPERPRLLQAARETLFFLKTLGKSPDGAGSFTTKRLERAIKDFEHVRSIAHEEAFADGSLDDDAYAQATSHVLNWVAGEAQQSLDNMLEDA